MKKTNRLISMLLIVLILFSVACVSVYAKVTFQSGDWVYEKINNETEFEIDDYLGSASTLIAYRSYNSIPITSIGSNAFSSNETLKKFTVSTSIKYIQEQAFLMAGALETVVLRPNVEYIGSLAFSNCQSLASINLESSTIATVTNSCFMNSDALTSIILPDTVTTIEENAFAYCDSLCEITIPASVTDIHDTAFFKSPSVVIYCYRDSVAHVYAENKGIEYVLLEDPTEPSTEPPTEPSTVEPTVPVETYILGDTDGDGQVSIMDPTTLQFVLALMQPDEDGRMAIRSDIDHDGVSSIMDATSIQRYVAQFDDGTDIGKTYEY